MKKITLLATTIIILIGCTKESEKPIEKSKTDLLTQEKWYYKAATVNPAFDWFNTGTKITDIYAQPQATCVIDNILTFYKDGRFEEDNGVIKCIASVPQIQKDFWYFTNQEKDIVIEGSQANIVQLDATTLILKRVEVRSSISYTTLFTFKH